MRRLIIVFISLLFFSHYAQAALDLELTQGINAALPIVVVPFANGKSAQVPGNETITQVINNDLNNSGQFRVISPSVMDQTPSTVSQVNFNLWRKKGGNDIVIGQVNALGADRYQVSFQLLSLYSDPAKTKEANENNATLLNQSFTVAKSGLRVLAHHISDLIYQKLTGVRGVFNTKIAYVLLQRNPLRPQQAIHQLMVSDMDGFNPQVLLKQKAPIMSPAWSPNGKQLAYVSFENHHAAIYVQNLATGQRRKVSDSPGINGAPAFSPNGQQLALVLTRTGNPKIYTLNLNTNQLTQITRGYSIDTEPAWSPDGKNLIFTSNRGGNPQIYDYNFASKQVQRLTFSGKYNARASFLPNDQGIVMMHRDDSMFSIARQNLQSGRVTELTAAGDDESPSVAPNGKMVIYATNYGGTGVLAMVSIDGRVKLRLPAQDGNVQDPAWSPFLNIS